VAGSEERCIHTFGEETRDPMEDVGVDERIILKFIFRKQYGVVDWVDLAHDRTYGGLMWSR
jgi:hypothetical protein